MRCLSLGSEGQSDQEHLWLHIRAQGSQDCVVESSTVMTGGGNRGRGNSAWFFSQLLFSGCGCDVTQCNDTIFSMWQSTVVEENVMGAV